MNRFRTRKKSHDGGESVPRPSDDSDVPAMPSFASRARTFRRTKKQQPEPKPEPTVDLSTALPSSDDFRTSLLMPNLSARFSMLREQDDPNSKIGKASDDSVLFPKRVSRLNIFSSSGLSDVAETSTLNESIRPPFAYGTRANSFGSADGYGTDDDSSQNGSVMSRSRGGEGNKFFGGRQKIYIIPVGGSASSKDITIAENGEHHLGKRMNGRHVYDDDVAMSAFQMLKEKERQGHEENQELERQAQQPDSKRSSKENDRPRSSSFTEYNRKRETTSSTTSVPSNTRISTGATSVASQSVSPTQDGNHILNATHVPSTSKQPSTTPPHLERTATKSRRMYGQGLDQEMYEQQSSAMSRLESLQRQRAFGGKSFPRQLSQSRSATNLNDRYQRSGHLGTSARAGSPPDRHPAPGLAGFDLGLNHEDPARTPNQPESGFGRSGPLSTSTFVASLEPNDLGKATASGAFDKPRNQYDEEQYAQRQVQLQQGRETPPPRRYSPSETLPGAGQTAGRSRNGSFASIQSKSSSMRDQQVTSSKDNALSSVPEAITTERSSGQFHDHQVADDSSAPGSNDSESPKASSDLERNPSLEKLNSSVYEGVPTAKDVIVESDPSIDVVNDAIQPQQDPYLPFIDLSEEPEIESPSQKTTPEHCNVSLPGVEITDINDADSPTLGPVPDLSGLVRTHLRRDSGQSSIYPSNSPGLNKRFSSEACKADNNPGQTSTFHNNSWVNDEWDGDYFGAAHQDSRDNDATKAPPLSIRARQILEQATALRNLESSKVQQVFATDKALQVLGGEAPRQSHDSASRSTWQEQVKSHHFRGGSTETEKEREDLATELAERRRRVQDNLKSFVESDSSDNSPLKTNGSFGLMKPKTGRVSTASKQENPSKAMKMLGLVANPQNIPSPENTKEQSFRQPNIGPKYLMSTTHAGPQFHRSQSEVRTQGPLEAGEERAHASSTRQPSPPSSRPRGAAPAAPMGNLRFRHGDYQAQDARPAIGARGRTDGYSPHHPQPHVYVGLPRSPAQALMQNQAPYERSQSAMSGRMRSNGQSVPPRRADQRPLMPIQTNSLAAIGRSPRPSPIAPYAAHATPPLYDTSPGVSAASTPTPISNGNFPATTRVPFDRKRSVNKYDISEPTFMSCTSSVNTVNLPPGASLSNGTETPPPVPPINPRRQRRTTTTQHIFGFGRTERVEAPPLQTTNSEPYEERSTFSADEGEPRPKSRQRLRKTSSEGGNLAAKARQQAMMAPSPAMPHFPQEVAVPGRMF